MRSGESAIFDGRHGVPVPHCYLVITPVVEDKVVVVNFTTLRETTSEAWQELIANPGDHPFIEVSSCIPFSKAVLMTHSRLVAAIEAVEGTTTYGKMNPALHGAIISGLISSKHTPRNVKRFITENFGAAAYLSIKACVVDAE